jgi:hypothetical protein
MVPEKSQLYICIFMQLIYSSNTYSHACIILNIRVKSAAVYWLDMILITPVVPNESHPWILKK